MGVLSFNVKLTMEKDAVVYKVQSQLKMFCNAQCKVIAAVSGGADSMALADACAQLQQEGYLSLAVVHVEHGLRGEESLRDAQMVEEYCSKHGIPFYLKRAAVSEYAEKYRLSTENAARNLRYAALQSVAKETGADYILTAHHMDDQAETVLLKLLRGTSAEGLGGMQRINGNILRPFLDITRDELEDYCRVRELTFCHDSSNDDIYYTRNRVRLELLPYLAEAFNPDIRRILVQTARLQQEDQQFIDKFAEKEYKARVVEQKQSAELKTGGWESLAGAVRKRLLRKCYFAAGGTELSFVQTEALDKMCLAGRSGKMLDLPQQIKARYAYEKISFARGNFPVFKAESWETDFKLADSFTVKVPAGIIKGRLIYGQQPPMKKNTVIYPAELLGGLKLCLRRRRAGDRFAPYGGAGSKKLKAYLIDKKVPQNLRDELLLVCADEKILGILGLANAAWPEGEYNKWLSMELTERENENEQ